MQVSEELTRLLANLGRALNTRRTEFMPQTDAGVLFTLSAHPDGMRLGDLAHLKGLDASTMSRRVAYLTDKGFIERVKDPDDRRACLIALTDEGRRTVSIERGHRVRFMTSALQDWEAQELEDLAQRLSRLNDSLENTHE